MRWPYATERLLELRVVLPGCPVIETGHGGPAVNFMSLSALVSNSAENPTPSSSKFSRLTAIDLRLPIAGRGPAKERAELFELFRHERAPEFGLSGYCVGLPASMQAPVTESTRQNVTAIKANFVCSSAVPDLCDVSASKLRQ
jgi:hypothetical protein